MTTINFAMIAAVEDTFWSYVDKTGTCWLWCGGTRRGYPIFDDRSAARVAWELTYGDVPHGRHVRRRCTGRMCVRPEHLLADGGIHVKRPAHKLSAMQADDVRARRAAGETVAEVARIYGVTAQHVGNIVRGRVWTSDGVRRPKSGSVLIVGIELAADGTKLDKLACGHGVQSTPWPNKWRRCTECNSP